MSKKQLQYLAVVLGIPLIAACLALVVYIGGSNTLKGFLAPPTSEPTPTATLPPTEEVPPNQSQPPQTQERHPSLYVETGVGQTRVWRFSLAEGEVLIIGGWKVDDQEQGVYQAVAGPAEISVSVTDGFAIVVAKQWAHQEFCFRVKQAKEYGWAHEHVRGLPDWEPCE